jgi:nucleotide-binding universal stress UspA family protein
VISKYNEVENIFKEVNMYKSILVPLDGSKLSECTLQHVKAIVQGCQVSNVTLLTVIEPPQQFIMENGGRTQVEAMFQEQKNMQAKALDNANKYLIEASSRLSKDKIDAKTDVVQAPRNTGVADVILEYAKNNATDLIIMSTHGRSGITRWAMGSIADKVVRSSVFPVLLVAPSGCRT